MTRDKRHKAKPELIRGAVENFLARSGLAKRVEQAAVVPEWPTLVGEQVASVTEPLFVSRDGTLFVAVQNNSWMMELSLLEPQLLNALNAGRATAHVQRIHWRLMR